MPSYQVLKLGFSNFVIGCLRVKSRPYQLLWSWPSIQGCRGSLCIKPYGHDSEKNLNAKLFKLCIWCQRDKSRSYQILMVLTFISRSQLLMFNVLDKRKTFWQLFRVWTFEMWKRFTKKEIYIHVYHFQLLFVSECFPECCCQVEDNVAGR